MRKIVLFILLIIVLVACDAPTNLPPTPDLPSVQPLENVTLADNTEYVSPALDGALQYADLIDGALNLTAAEQALLDANGFLVTDRVQWNRFVEAYAWIYWQDLPVIITTDSILHGVHQSYVNMLQELEMGLLQPQLNFFLDDMVTSVSDAAKKNDDPDLTPLYNDLLIYFTTAQQLLSGSNGSEFVRMAKSADSHKDITLFGVERTVDFTLFKPRGHYTQSEKFEQYFRAMQWLAQIDFRFVTYDPVTSEPTVHPEALATAHLLLDNLDAIQRNRWNQIDGVLQMLVGQSDNMVLSDFERLLADASIADAKSALAVDTAELLKLLNADNYGQQRITGQIIYRDNANQSETPIPRPVSFMLLGQRFALDSFVFSNLVFDNMMTTEGRPIKRALPDPLDVAYALGNDRAITHLQAEIDEYGYEGHLAAQRAIVDGMADQFWQAPFYNQWLNMIRALNQPISAEYPATMQTSAYADKTLQTQLASWAQLRHDNILYVKQSFTSQVACEYPAAYVEPRPAFYFALYELAANSHDAIVALTGANDNTVQRFSAYFNNLADIAQTLQMISEKQLADQPLTQAETDFLKSVVKRQEGEFAGCAGPEFEDIWDGWYMHLIYGNDDNPALIADVHTNPNDQDAALSPPRVLHSATGYPVPILFTDGETLYVGPAFSYYETLGMGNPPQRYTDEEWRDLLATQPPAPEWTQSFRVPANGKPQVLTLPTYDVLLEHED